MRPSIPLGACWILRECIDACYSPLGSDRCLCDEDGRREETIVTAVLAHEVIMWNKVQREELRAFRKGPMYEGF